MNYDFVSYESSSYLYDENESNPSDIIYQRYRNKKLEKKELNILIILSSIILAAGSILTIVFLNVDQAYASFNKRTDYLNAQGFLCDKFNTGVIDIICTSISTILIIIYIIIYKRRVFLREKFKYRNVGVPMINSSWSKTNRFYTSIVYGLIALQVYIVIISTIFS
jgi:hypothetical protein